MWKQTIIKNDHLTIMDEKMLKVHDLYFEHYQKFDDFELDSKGYVVINVTFSLCNESGESLFYFDLSNDINLDSDYQLLNNFGIFFRTKGKFTFYQFNKYELKSFLLKLIEIETKFLASNQETLLKISEYFHWEYDNYRDVK